MSIKYSLLPTILPAVSSGAVLFAFDVVFTKSGYKQSLSDASALAIAQVLGGEIISKILYKVADNIWPMKNMNYLRSMVVTPGIVAYIYNYLLYDSAILSDFGVNIPSIRTRYQNLLLAYASSLVGTQVVHNNLLKMLF